jgi:hypothetical protein
MCDAKTAFNDATAHGSATQACIGTPLSGREEVDGVALGAVGRTDAMLTGSAERKLEQRTLAAHSEAKLSNQEHDNG